MVSPTFAESFTKDLRTAELCGLAPAVTTKHRMISLEVFEGVDRMPQRARIFEESGTTGVCMEPILDAGPVAKAACDSYQ